MRDIVGRRLAVGSVIALTLSWGAPVLAQSIDLKAQLEELRAEQARIAELQRSTENRLRELEARILAAQSAPSVKAESAPSPAPSKAPAPPPRFVVSGDLRLRMQGDYADGARDRESGQVRGRLGATYALNEVVSFGARMVTGDPDDPNSTDAQLSNFADDLQVSLDQAYTQLTFGNLKLTGGKIPQPFARTDLVWDGDVNPQGVSAAYRRAMAGGGGLRASSVFFIIDERATDSESTMVGAQLGYDTPALGDWKFDVSGAYYDYRLGSVVGGDSGDFRSNLLDASGNYVSDFNLGNLIVGASWSGAGERWPLRIVGDYVHNFGARTPDDSGFGVDLSLGRASQAHDWRMTYGYSLAETDAVLAAFSHDNIGIATNYRLHALTFDYVPFPKTTFSAIWYHYQPYRVAPEADDSWRDRLRIMFMTSF